MPTEKFPGLGGTVSLWAARPVRPLALIMLVGLALRVVHLDRIALWNDELFSRYYPLTGLRFMWGHGFTMEPTPPLYYTLLDGWMQVFGSSEQGLRSLSVVCAVLAIPLVFLLGREFFGAAGGLVAATLCALAPTGIFYAQEARSYAFLLLSISLMLLGLAKFLRPPHSNRAILLFAASSIVALYSHVTMLLLVAACNAAAGSALLGPGRLIGWRDAWRWGLAQLPVALAAIPIIMIVRSPLSGNGLDWIPPLTAHDILWSIEWTVAGPLSPTQHFGYEASAIVLGLLALTVAAHPPERRLATVVYLVPLVFLLLLIAASLHRSIFIPRILSWMWVPFSVVLAERLLTATRARAALACATGITVALGLMFQLTATDSGTDPWRDFVRLIRPEFLQKPMVVLAPSTSPTGLAYYVPDLGPTWHWDEPRPPTVENTVIPALFPQTQISRGDLAAAIDSGRHILMVLHPGDLAYLPKLLSAVKKPPARRLEQPCGGGICLIALVW